MEQLALSELQPGVRLTRPLFHSSGEVLFEVGSVVTTPAVRAMAEAGIDKVCRRERGEDQQEFALAIRSQIIPISSLKVGGQLAAPIYDHEGTLLAEAGRMVTRGMVRKIRRRGGPHVYARKTKDELKIEQVEAFRQAMVRLARVRPVAVREQIDAARMLRAEECTAERIDGLIESGELAVPRGGAPLAGQLRAHAPLQGRSVPVKDSFLGMYEEALGSAVGILRAFELGRSVEEERLSELARTMLGGLIADREMLLSLHGMTSEGGHLPGHALGVTALAIATAADRGCDQPQVLEMACAALLHDVGMLRVPGGIVNRPRQLSRMELMQIQKHPLHALEMLKGFRDRRGELAGVIPVVAYQTHERENGSGYPRGRRGPAIHEFAKIVAVCDVYQALASPRPWRAALLPYQAMEQVVLMGRRRELDPEAIRALLRCLSLFPIGSWVELADGARGRVVAASEGDFARPVVSVMYRGGIRLGQPQRLNLAEHQEAAIAGPIAAPEDSPDPMAGF
jgi:HD-GYP domain-containing protein (c-di-GMP phosphodiesterase class II)